MSTNYRQARRDDSSDDEGPTKRVKHAHANDDDDDESRTLRTLRPVFPMPKRAGSSRNTVWTDVVQEEELSIRGNVMDMEDYRKKGEGGFVKIRRGAESYVVPSAQLEENAAALEAGKNMEELPPLTAAVSSDDPFGDTADLGEVEAFGVGPSSGGRGGRGRGGNWHPRGARGRGVKGGWMNQQRGGGNHHHPHHNGEGDASMEMGEGDEGGSSNTGGHRGRGGGWRGGQQRGAGGFVPRGRGGQWRGGVDDRKRRWNEGCGQPKAKDPAELMDTKYSLAGLMATEFQEGLSPKELGEQIAKALGERESDTVVKICVAVGEKKSLEIFEETKKAEQAGGVKVADGSRRRTPGGVFIMLFKADIDVDPSVKGSIFEENKAIQRKVVKAKRRGEKPQDVSKGLDELQAMLEARKKELAEGKPESPEEGEATPSPENDGNEELDYTEEDEGTEME